MTNIKNIGMCVQANCMMIGRWLANRRRTRYVWHWSSFVDHVSYQPLLSPSPYTRTAHEFLCHFVCEHGLNMIDHVGDQTQESRRLWIGMVFPMHINFVVYRTFTKFGNADFYSPSIMNRPHYLNGAADEIEVNYSVDMVPEVTSQTKNTLISPFAIFKK